MADPAGEFQPVDKRQIVALRRDLALMEKAYMGAQARTFHLAEQIQSARAEAGEVRALLRRVMERTVPSILGGGGRGDPLWDAVRVACGDCNKHGRPIPEPMLEQVLEECGPVHFDGSQVPVLPETL